ncbi:MAG: undecaprenyl-diphosphate phosphatase [Nanoarchaeota archaeon]
MSELIAALILAVVQGITEWLPISSSGHLVIFEKLLGYDGGLFFEVALHFGTLMAVFVYFGQDIVDILRDLLNLNFKSENGKIGIFLIIASIPAGIIGLFFHNIISVSGNWIMLALGFLISSIILFIGSSAPAKVKKLGFLGAIFVGLMQIFSLFRGVSRSGSTITAGLLAGLNEKQAIKFSYLLSIPIILGANIILVGNNTLPSELIWAALVSFFVSLGAMHFSFNYILNNRKNLRWLGIYLLVVALALGVYSIVS